MDVTDYLMLYRMSGRQLGQRIMQDIYEKLGIRAACGIGTNLYLAKVALDITAKHARDFIGFLDEDIYKKTLWSHRPLTDFWRVGAGTAKRLADYGIYTMRDIAGADEDFLYGLFGIDAELLIDHARGTEPVTIADIKAYRPKTSCLTSSQVLGQSYDFEKGELVVREMTDLLCLDLVEKGLVTQSVTLHIGYDYSAGMPPAHGTADIETDTNADMVIIPAAVKLYRRIVRPDCPIRRISITFNRVMPEEYQQYSFFADADELEKNRKIQETVLNIKNRFGKDAVLKGMNLKEGATTPERNHQIGGHRSGT